MAKIKKIKKILAFTLAEVLITLAIIGIVAAITVPTIAHTYNEQVYVSALKKNYSVLSNAFKLSKDYDYNDYKDWSHKDSNNNVIWNNYTYLKQYLYVIRECKNKKGCWSEDITKAPTGQNAMSASEIGIGGNIITFTLNDGTNVGFDYWSKSDIVKNFGVEKDLFDNTLSIFVDVNGDKKPNMLGRDVFAFILTENGLIPAGNDNESRNCKTTGYDCAAKYIHK